MFDSLRSQFSKLKRLKALLFAVALTLPASVVALAESKPKVVATLAMIAEPVEWVADGRADVSAMMGAGVDPHLYRATRSDIAKLVQADLILWNGLDLEAQLEDALVSLGDRTTVVAVGEAVAETALQTDEEGKRDPHLWMDPALWRAAITVAVQSLKDVDPDNAAHYAERLDLYMARLDQLDAYAETAMATVPADARYLVTAHDAFGYFGSRFNLTVRGIQGISTESEAGLRAIEDMVDLLVEQEIPAVFVETSVSERNVRALIEGAAARDWSVRIGGTLYSDAMGDPGTYEGTYIGMVDANVTRIVRAMGGDAPAGGMVGEVAP